LQTLQLRKSFQWNYENNNLVLTEYEAVEDKRRRLNVLKIKADPAVIITRNESFNTTGKEQILIEQSIKQYQFIRNNHEK
jgi:hypothetical protein